MAIAALLAGCAAPQTRELLARGGPTGLPPATELDGTPFFPQEEHQCGPAALATALSAAGVPTTPDQIVPQVYLPGREGSLQVEMLASARKYGTVPYLLQPRLQDVLSEVAAGTPVVVLQNLGLPWFPVWHYAVVVGYDLPEEQITLRSGREQRLAMSLSTFERTWARSDKWGFVALPPDRLPATAAEDRYVSSVVTLENIGSIGVARRAYQTALAKWPDNLTALVGLGNTAYVLKDLNAAELALRRATQEHPESDIAFNNLANVLLERRKFDEALEAARHAVELAGPNQAEAARTLAEIEAAARP